MAELWLARDERADANVALKFLKPEFAADPGRRERFHKEWRAASRLMHPHIVRVFEYHDEAEGPFYALQYLSGPDIGVLANEPLDRALPPFGLLADALRYAHGKNFVHRDIKAANVLLDERGAPYLIDFGVAAAPGEAAGGGSAIATPPGGEEGGRTQTADDVYALGVLMHEIVAGEPPADGVSARLTRPDGEPVPRAVRQLLADMLDPDPARRPDAETVAARLSSAGFPAAAAPLRGVRPVPDEDLEPTKVSVRSVRRDRPATAAAPVASGPSGGVSARFVYGGLALLLFLFVGVIFVLPDAVDRARDDAVPAAQEVPAPAPEPAAAPATDAPALDPAEERRRREAADEALGELLSRLESLKLRGVERWGDQPYLDMLEVYRAGDEAYLDKNYGAAAERYREAGRMLDPLFDRIDSEFARSLEGARDAFEAADPVEAVRLYDLAVAITPGHPEAEKGLERAMNLEDVLELMDQGLAYEDELELDAARLAFEKAVELDPEWAPATAALARVRQSIRDRSFDMRMTEGFDALALGNYASARAAFEAAKVVKPESREPGDGLLQVDQEIRLARIRSMEAEAQRQEADEQWEDAVATYEALLEVDADLMFAQDGLARARARAALHGQLQGYIDDPDSLSDPATMQRATRLLLDVARAEPSGPRLEDQRDELSRLLKRAATPVTVTLVSDNLTEVSVYKVGRLGSFAKQSLELRPGNYVAVGIRPGYRDVRREFYVAPEIDMEPIVVQCQEPI